MKRFIAMLALFGFCIGSSSAIGVAGADHNWTIHVGDSYYGVSGYDAKSMPGFLQAIADVLPLTYLLRLIRDVFVDGKGLTSAPGSVAAIAVWGVVGVLLASRMFQWEPREA